jgi:hypothetical protein
MDCLTSDWSYFEQERTERTEAKAPFSLFSPVKHTTTHLRDTALKVRQRDLEAPPKGKVCVWKPALEVKKVTGDG